MNQQPLHRRRFCPPSRLVAVVWGLVLVATAALAVDDDPCARGQKLYRAGEFDAAREALTACLETTGDQVEILLPLAIMDLRERNLPRAVDLVKRAVVVAPEDPDAYYWYGRALLRSGRTAEARAQWEKGMGFSVEHVGLLEGLARLSLSEGEAAKAYNLLTQLQRQGVDDGWLHHLLAEIAAGKGLWEPALSHLEDAMARDEPNLEDLIMASELAVVAQQPDKALVFGRRAVAHSAEARSYGTLGETFFALDEVDSALVYLRLAVALPGAASRYSFNLANALEVAGLFSEAGEQFRAYVAAEPDDPAGHFNYAIHLDKGGRSVDALAELAKTIEVEPGHLNARVIRTQILEGLGRWDDALAEVEALREWDPRSAAELREWSRRLETLQAAALAAHDEGKVHLLYMVVSDPEVLERVEAELTEGVDFSDVTMRYSEGPAAARGGDIGWIRPAEMVEPLRGAIESLSENEISPPTMSRGLYHLFKRVP